MGLISLSLEVWKTAGLPPARFFFSGGGNRHLPGVDKLSELDGVILVGFKRDFEDDGVVCLAPPPPLAGAGGSGAGDFLDRNGESDDLSDLVVEDIWEGDWSVERESGEVRGEVQMLPAMVLPPLGLWSKTLFFGSSLKFSTI